MIERRKEERRTKMDRRIARTKRRIRDGLGYLTVDQGRRGNVSDRRNAVHRVLHRRVED